MSFRLSKSKNNITRGDQIKLFAYYTWLHNFINLKDEDVEEIVDRSNII